MDAKDVTEVAAHCAAFLDGVAEADWTAVVPDLDRTVAQVVAHTCDSVLWYATDLAAGPVELSTAEVRVRPDSAPRDLVRTLETSASVLASVLAAVPEGARGWHAWGVSDAAGFAAMACDEMLVHTHDAGRGLAVAFEPPPRYAEEVVARLFPDAPTGHDPVDTLLWANGRAPLGELPRREGWRWHSAPPAS
ncbi:maleylpyruvate isomerase N-terminal domain-containing protein [Actinosynnema sp. NPDC059797]